MPPINPLSHHISCRLTVTYGNLRERDAEPLLNSSLEAFASSTPRRYAHQLPSFNSCGSLIIDDSKIDVLILIIISCIAFYPIDILLSL